MTPGTRLGPYEIVAPIGAGGMGEVYRARDTRLDRQVAVKILPEHFAHNASFKIRFEREAKTISQLSHPNICTLYDVGDNYLVMELLDGETLAQRLTKVALPLSDVLKYGTQIAQALGRAHRAGVIHRDLKPGNIMLTKHGAKLLDFGLAKGGAPPTTAAQDATEQKPLTAEGTVLGTYQYMAPEQLAAEEPDARTDIFALGLVLYEMATGRRAFEGKTRTSLVAAILSGEPRPMSELLLLAPRSLEHVVTKCLAKDPEDRWQSASDIAEELRWIGEEDPGAAVRRKPMWPWIVAAAAVALIIGAMLPRFTSRQAQQSLVYTEVTPPENSSFIFDTPTMAISPDGQQIALVMRVSNGIQALWLRRFDSPAPRMLNGTEGAAFPFWSPDSRNIGFFADGKLKRIDVSSGISESLTDASTPRGGAWNSNGTIVFAPTPATPIFAVSASAGGQAHPVTTLDVNLGHGSHRFPTFLPDGRHFLFFVQGALGSNVLVGSLDSRERVYPLINADAAAIFTPPDVILFVRDRMLRAQHINLKTFTTAGDSVPVAEHIQISAALNFANMSAGNNGLLAYVVGGSGTMTSLKLVDRHGKELASLGPPAEQLDPRMAPDGHAVVFSKAAANGNFDIFQLDLRRNVTTRLTFSPVNEFGPIWSPDSTSIVYTTFEQRPGDLIVKRVDSSGPGDVVVSDKRRKIASDWSRDGNYIIYHALTPGFDWDVEAYSLHDHKVIPLLHGTYAERLAKLSPDGKWLAYSSSESGHEEVYVRAFPTATEKWQISNGGGTMPIWSRDGHELYFATGENKLMVAKVRIGEKFAADAPQTLFSAAMRILIGVTRTQYDVTADGRFLINVTTPGAPQPPVTVVQNWTAKLSRNQ